ncbi:hypothetical protein [uncultured Rubinisphaera sp.]|uniref:hypothetical protein n=1 Tax=uncultured Rubinisphaera sp. TaxID=1678686 RepID=UPI0030DA14C5|tara:strand:- start:1177 stop:1632 length:456 start_codon:yes stop_codon:yes gene_type:complete
MQPPLFSSSFLGFIMKLAGYHLSLCFSVLMLLGCGGGSDDTPELGKVSGTIKIDGKELPDVAVTFSPVAGGRASTGVTDSSGFYELYFNSTTKGAIIGKHNVFVSGSVDHDVNDPNAPMVPPAGNVPKDYSNIEKQEDVKAGSNTINLTYP